MPSENLIEILIRAKNEADKELKSLNSRLDDLESGSKDAAGGVDKLGGGLGGLKTAALAVGGALVAMGIARATREIKEFARASVWAAAEVAEQAAVLEMLGERAGWTTAEIEGNVEAMRRLRIRTDKAQGMLMEFARYQLDAADALAVATVAEDAAAISGADVATTIERINRGIFTQNTQLLRNAGLLINVNDAMATYADTQGRTVDELSEQERVQAMVNAVVAEGERISGSFAVTLSEAARQTRDLKTYMYEAQIAVGHAFLPTFSEAIEASTEMIESIRDMLEEGELLYEIFENLGRTSHAMAEGFRDAMQEGEWLYQTLEKIRDITEWVAAVAEARQANKELARSFEALHDQGVITEETYDKLTIAQSGLTAAFDWGRMEADDFAEGLGELEGQMADIIGVPLDTYLEVLAGQKRAATPTAGEIRQWQMLGSALNNAGAAARNAAAGLREARSQIGAYAREQAGITLIEPLDDAARAARDRYERTQALYGKSLQEQAAFHKREMAKLERQDKTRTAEYIKHREELYKLQVQMNQKTETEAGRSASAIAETVEDHSAELRSSLESAFRPTDVTELDMARTRLGVYEDKVDEFVRRIRAEAQDSRGAWEQLIPQDILDQGEDAIKVWTAEAEDMFYGLRWDELEAMTGGAFDPQVAEERWLQAAENEIRAMRHYEARIEAMIPKLAARLGGLTTREVEAVSPTMATEAPIRQEPDVGYIQEQAMATGRVWQDATIESLGKADYMGTIVAELRQQTEERASEIASIGEQIASALLEGAEGAVTSDVVSGIASALGPDMVRWMESAGVLG